MNHECASALRARLESALDVVLATPKIVADWEPVDTAIALLDALDGDTELEPWLGFAEASHDRVAMIGEKWCRIDGLSQLWVPTGGSDDREGDWDEREPDFDHVCVSFTQLSDGTDDQSRPANSFAGCPQ